MKKGTLLVAEPSICGDQNFHRSVVLIVNSKEESTLGFILNKPLHYKLKDVLDGVRYNFQLYFGGPVEPDNLFYVHNCPNQIENSIPIANGLYWGGDFSTVLQLVNTQAVDQDNIRFFLGYAGWDKGQRQKEIDGQSWVLCSNPHKENLMKYVKKDFWREQMIALVGKYLLWSNAPENPSYN